MQVSIININWINADAIGQSINKQVEFFLRRGDDVAVYTLSTPVGVTPELARLARVTTADELAADPGDHFTRSDLYIYHYPCRHALIESMTMLERGVVMLYYHNVTPPELWEHPGERELLAFSLRSLPRVLAHADLVVTPSAYNARTLEEEHGADPSRIRVLPLSVPLDQFAPRPPHEELVSRYDLGGKRVMLFVGRVASNKRIDLLIDALAELRESHPDLVLLVVGEGDDSESQRALTTRLREQVDRLGLSERVHFTGRVDAVAPYYNLADLYVTASLHEGFGVPLIEAMASGVPVIASDATAHPQVVEEAGLLVEPDDAAALAEGIARLLDHPDERQDLVKRGLDRVKRFSESEVALQWSQIVAEAVSWLPAQVYPRVEPEHLVPHQTLDPLPAQRPPAAPRVMPPEVQERIGRLRDQAITMDRSYTVRSQIPLVATVRHHLTSHLHQPYIDPTFERQSSWNQDLVALLNRLAEQVMTDQPGAEQNGSDSYARLWNWLDGLAQQAETMDRSYEVRSKIPMVATVRRHLTSHLHEPYVNPAFERQARFNQEVIAFLRDMVARNALSAPATPDNDTAARLQQAEARQNELAERLERQIGQLETRVAQADARISAQYDLDQRLDRLEMQVQLLGQQLTLLLAERNSVSDSLILSLRETTEALQRSVADLRQNDR